MVAWTGYSGHSCWETAREFTREAAQAEAELRSDLEALNARAVREGGPLYVRLALARGAITAQERGLRLQARRQHQEAALGLEQTGLANLERNNDYQAQVDEVRPGSMQDCFQLMATLEQKVSSLTVNMLTGDFQERVQACSTQMRTLQSQMTGAVTLLERLPSDVEGRLQDAQRQVDQLGQQLGRRMETLLGLEELRRDEALLKQRADLMEVGQQAARQQWERRQREAAQQTWWRLLLSRGARAWLWWLHLGGAALGLVLLLVLTLRIFHLLGMGGSLRLQRGGRA
jgi:hypothetical protein